ncbi:MAG TPA: thioredoxin domain-containing protein [Syntrophorhabdaceae bacterium]|nr:thioredoxin domain-containing protein [Syntrophorhabdaceae bacterium]
MFFKKDACKSLFFYLFFLLLFSITLPHGILAQEEESKYLPTFGKGSIKIRLYTDYFCGPCDQLEAQIEGLLKTLIEKNIITITFIDVPFSQYSSMYVKHFLYALNKKRSLDFALKTRKVLFSAAKNRIVDAKGLTAYLNQNQIDIKPFDEKGVYQIFENYLNKEDKINVTPTCVIIEDEKKEFFKGINDITNALKRLM